MSTLSHKPARFNFSLDHLWVTASLGVGFILLCLMPLREGDLWWHIKAGETTWLNRAIPSVDLFSLTEQGREYLFSYSWLSELLLFLLSWRDGLAALVIFQALVGLSIFVLILSLSQSRRAGLPATAFFMFMGWIGFYPFLSIRPQTFSFLCFTLLLAALSAPGKAASRRLWLLPVVVILWVNLHAAWSVGLLLLGITLAVEVYGERGRWQNLLPLLAWSGLATLALLVNPEGWGAARMLLSVSSNTLIQTAVSEWQPAWTLPRVAWPMLLILASLAFLFAIRRRFPRGLLDAAYLLVFGVLAVRYVRMLPYFYVVAIPILAEMASGLDLQRLTRRLHSQKGSLPRRDLPRLNGLMIALFAAAMIFSLPPVRLTLTGQPERSLIDASFPIDACEYLDSTNRAGLRIFSLAEWGGYLIWRLYPQGHVFTDGRADLYPDEIWRDYFEVNGAAPQWMDILQQYDINVLLLSKDRQGLLIQAAAQKGWRVQFEDANSVVFFPPP
jgi:hypothetical protein